MHHTLLNRVVGFAQAVMQAYIIAKGKKHIFGSTTQHWRHGLNNCLHWFDKLKQATLLHADAATTQGFDVVQKAA